MLFWSLIQIDVVLFANFSTLHIYESPWHISDPLIPMIVPMASDEISSKLML